MTDPTDDIERVYGAHFPKIYGFCARRLIRRDLIEDATSEVFMRLAERFPAMRDKNDAEIRNWLYGTARNAIAKHYRYVRHSDLLLSELNRRAQDGVEPGLDKLDWPVLYEAVAALSPRQQELITLRYFQGLKTVVIADVLGMRHTAVRVGLSRAVKRLKLILGKKLEK